MAVFLGIDSGTQSTKAILVHEDGRVLGRGSAPHAMIEGLGLGHKEQDPAVWIAALCDAVKAALANAGIPPSDVAAIGVSGQQHGFVPLDAADNVIRPAKLWCDTATAAEAEEIIERLGGRDASIRLTGNSVPAGFTASKILWLKKHEPENFARLRSILLPHDYLNFWLTGEKRMEPGDASGTALLDVRTRIWRAEAINAIDPRVADCLPPLMESSGVCGRLRSSAAQALGLSPGIAVSAGGGDNMMGAIGTGNVRAGVVTISLGTSGTVYAFSNAPVVDTEAGEIAAFCDSTGNWLPLLCTMNVTVATELVKKTFAMSTEEVEREASRVAAGAGGLALLPYFEGERTPDVPDGTGVWLGYNATTHTRGHFARAAMEGPSLGLAYGFARMQALGVEPSEIRLTGGGSKSPLWRRILASVFAVPVVCTTELEGAALGAAIQACWALERERNNNASIAELCAQHVALDESTRAEPEAREVEVYRGMQTLHNAMSTALRPVFRSHRALVANHFAEKDAQA